MQFCGHETYGLDVPVITSLAMMDSVDLPSGTLTFLMSDVEGSTTLWEAAREARAVALPRSLEMVEVVASAHGGALPIEQGEGDSRLAVFPRAADGAGSCRPSRSDPETCESATCCAGPAFTAVVVG